MKFQCGAHSRMTFFPSYSVLSEVYYMVLLPFSQPATDIA
ncbi:hypothetical protein V6Z11_D11G169400 [Gossypium hirsutum]